MSFFFSFLFNCIHARDRDMAESWSEQLKTLWLAREKSLRTPADFAQFFATDVVQQCEFLTRGMNSPSGFLSIVKAAPGAGKSYVIKQLVSRHPRLSYGIFAVNRVNVHTLTQELRNECNTVDIDIASVAMIAGVASGRAFDMVIVDEAQDLDPTIVPRIANLVRGGGHLLLLGDDHQLLRTGTSGIAAVVEHCRASNWFTFQVIGYFFV